MTLTETKLVERLKEWYGLAIEPSAQKQWRQRAAKSLRFYDGTGQWSETLKMTLEGQGRPALTIKGGLDPCERTEHTPSRRPSWAACP